MAIFIFRCPNTDQNVQGSWSSEDIQKRGDTYLPLRCFNREAARDLPRSSSHIGRSGFMIFKPVLLRPLRPIAAL